LNELSVNVLLGLFITNKKLNYRKQDSIAHHNINIGTQYL